MSRRQPKWTKLNRPVSREKETVRCLNPAGKLKKRGSLPASSTVNQSIIFPNFRNDVKSREGCEPRAFTPVRVKLRRSYQTQTPRSMRPNGSQQNRQESMLPWRSRRITAGREKNSSKKALNKGVTFFPPTTLLWWHASNIVINVIKCLVLTL